MFGRRPRPAEDAPDRATGRRFSGAPLILSLLLLLGAGGGVLWLHLTEQLEPLLASGPRIEVALPFAVSTDAAVEEAAEHGLAEAPASEDGTSAEAELAPPEPVTPGPVASEPVPSGTPRTESVQPAPPGPAPPGPATSGPAASADGAPEAGASEEGPPDESALAELTPAEAPPPGSEAAPAAEADEAAAQPDAPDGSEAPAAEEPATTEATTAESAPPPPAPPVPEIEPAPDDTIPAPAAEAEPAPPPRGEAPAPATAAEPAADNADAESPEADETAADAPQLAAATVPPGTVPAWQLFARPFPANENRPRIAVVVAGLGLSEAATTAAIQQLPSEITLSFSPYSNRIEEWVAMARAAGHEVMIDLPMEPTSFPRDDPGPQALLTSLSDGANAERLEWVLDRAEGYVGVASYMGSRFTTSPSHLRPVLEELSRRGLLFLDSRAAADSEAAKLAGEIGLTHAINDRFLDNEASRVAIDGRLQQIERIARTRDVAVAIGYAYPVTIERLIQWSSGLTGKGLALAPISAVADRQEDR